MPSNFLGFQPEPREHEATYKPIGFLFSGVWDPKTKRPMGVVAPPMFWVRDAYLK